MNPDKDKTLDQVGHHAGGDWERDAVAIEVLDEVVDEYLILIEMCPHAFGSCEQVPALEQRDPDSRRHLDRCWLDLEAKRSRREVRGEIGLAAVEEAPA